MFDVALSKLVTFFSLVYICVTEKKEKAEKKRKIIYSEVNLKTRE